MEEGTTRGLADLVATGVPSGRWGMCHHQRLLAAAWLALLGGCGGGVSAGLPGCAELRVKTRGVMCACGSASADTACICPAAKGCSVADTAACTRCSLPECGSGDRNGTLCCCGSPTGHGCAQRGQPDEHQHDCLCTGGAPGACLGAGLECAWCSPPPPPPPPPRRLRVALYVAPLVSQPGVFSTNDSSLPAFYRSVGVTDVLLPYIAGAFDVDNNTRMLLPDQARPTVRRYAEEAISAWMFERPAPAAEWVEHKFLWNSSMESDALWTRIIVRLAQRYPAARAAGFAGLSFDCEDYVSPATVCPAISPRLV